MFGTTVKEQPIENIRNKKFDLNDSTQIQRHIKELQKEMVRLSFQPNSKADIEAVVTEMNYLRDCLRKAKQA